MLNSIMMKKIYTFFDIKHFALFQWFSVFKKFKSRQRPPKWWAKCCMSSFIEFPPLWGILPSENQLSCLCKMREEVWGFGVCNNVLHLVVFRKFLFIILNRPFRFSILPLYLEITLSIFSDFELFQTNVYVFLIKNKK